MFELILIALIAVYPIVILRVPYYLLGGREMMGESVTLVFDLFVLVLLPWLFLHNAGYGLLANMSRVLITVITVAYFRVSLRSEPEPPVREFMIQFLLALGVTVNIVLCIVPITLLGALPILLLFVLRLERAHRSVIGGQPKTSELDTLNAYVPETIDPSVTSYNYPGRLSRFLTGPRIRVYPTLILLAVALLSLLYLPELLFA